MTLSGYGTQRILRISYEKDRQKALEDRTRFTDAELEELEITEDEGRGSTNYRKYQMRQWIPLDVSIRSRKKIDLRERPQIGGKF